ncbi:uncharacterized protein LOC132560407 [Ylistrum balloti]|uniref:uncharacterized protein LOC132560407 n=1 Tax=Ylistrum balloti TaxID=509963 RepID=UPI002905EA5D|nr:uncharacterized protein LOC132560407 [Ylistrum balloti]
MASAETSFCHWHTMFSRGVLVVILFILFPKTSGHLDKDLRLLSKFLPGLYSNKQQYLEDVKTNLPTDQRHLSMQFIFRPVQIHFLPNSFNVYVEQYINYDRAPFKQWLYSLKTDYKGMMIDMKIYNFNSEELKTRLKSDFTIIKQLDVSDLNSSAECNMLWRRLGPKKFIGTTRRQCLANINGEQVRIAMSATLTQASLQWHEGWYRVQDGSEVVKTVSPYDMIKIKKIKGERYVPSSDTEDEEARKAAHTGVKAGQRWANMTSSLPVIPKTSHKGRNVMNDRIAVPRKHRSWKLHNFEGVMSALMEGRKVHYAADIRKCSLVGRNDLERTAFGDFINVFEIHRSNGNNGKNSIKFSSSQKVKHGNDFVELLRDVTLYSDGTTVIDLYTVDPDKNEIIQQTIAVCWLYSPKTRKGDVRFTLDPRLKVRVETSFKSLKYSLQKGRNIRIVADLSNCAGSDDRRTIIGGEVKGYDMFGHQTEIGVALERTITDTQSENVISYRHFDVRITPNSRASMTVSDRGITKNIFNQYGGKETTHRCTVSRSTDNFSLILFRA